MIVIRTPFCGSHSGFSANQLKTTTSIQLRADRTAIEVLTALPRIIPNKPKPQIKDVAINNTSAQALEFKPLDLDDDRVQELLVDLSYRRIQLFYYLLIAYHDEKCTFHRSKPHIQYGKSNAASGSTAVYPSLYTIVKDDFFSGLVDKIRRNSLDERTNHMMQALGVTLTNNPNPGSKLMDLEGWTQSLLSKEAEFYHNLHQTVELPELIGKINRIIEDSVEELSGDILEECSEGSMNPYEATKLFVGKLFDFLDTCSKETKKKKEVYARCMELYEDIREAETKVLQDDHIESVTYLQNTFELLELMHEIDQMEQSLQVGTKLAMALHGRRDFFLRIISFLTKDIEYGVKIDKPKDFEAYFKGIRGRLEGMQEGDCELVNLPPRPMTIDEKKEQLRSCDVIDFTFADHKRRKEFPNILGDQLRLIPALPDVNFADELRELEDSYKACQWMSTGCQMPPEEYLSGVMEDGKLRAMTSDEKFQQKLQIITRHNSK